MSFFPHIQLYEQIGHPSWQSIRTAIIQESVFPYIFEKCFRKGSDSVDTNKFPLHPAFSYFCRNLALEKGFGKYG